jgi:phage repressor protein C with HTH and peptisase S24 domain
LEAPAIAASRLRLVRIVGPSMVPTLRHGDTVLVRPAAPVRPGDVVLARFRALPDRFVVKRAVREAEGGWWLASDNEFAGGDSTVHGVADVHGRVIVRLRRGLPGRVTRH